MFTWSSLSFFITSFSTSHSTRHESLLHSAAIHNDNIDCHDYVNNDNNVYGNNAHNEDYIYLSRIFKTLNSSTRQEILLTLSS
jgi:hypothetical protein